MPVTLAHIEHAAAEGEQAPPLLIAHGLFGSARNFSSLGRRLAKNRRVVTVDMRNHGQSPWDPDNTYQAMSDDLADAVERLCGGRAIVLGHSMGGKAAMTLALTEPDMVEGLIAADIAPVAYGHSHLGYVQAMQAVDMSRVSRRSDAEAMLATPIPDPVLRRFILQNLVIEGQRARWRFNLAALETGMEALIGFPDDFPETAYEGPAFFLHGGASDYAAPETHPRIRALFPDSEIECIPEAGHWLHADHPDAFVSKIAEWLRSVTRT